MPEPKVGNLKEFDPKDANACQGCSYCCEYVALEIDTPTSAKDFDFILWYVIHKDVWVYVDDQNDWYIQFNTPCEKLEQRRCSYHPQRPQICRDYEAKTCYRYVDEYEEEYVLKNEEDLYDYLAKKKPKVFETMNRKLGVKYKPKDRLQKFPGPIRLKGVKNG